MTKKGLSNEAKAIVQRKKNERIQAFNSINPNYKKQLREIKKLLNKNN